MARSLLVIAIAALSAAAGLAACDKPTPPATKSGGATAAQPLKAVVTIAPLKGLVEPLLPPGSTVEMLIPPGVSEHGYEIPPSKLTATAMADLVVIVGLGLEPQVEKFLKDKPRAGRIEFECAAALGLEHEEGEHNHKHGDKHEHADGDKHDHDHDHAVDPHVWLDPILARQLVTRLGIELGASAATAKQMERIEQVDEAYRTTLGSAKRRTIVVAHDAYGHLAKRYKLEVIAMAGLNAGEPKPADMKRAADVIREKGLTTIFVEPQLSKAAAERLAQVTGAKVAVLDPLGDGDWFALMDKNLAALAEALDAKRPEKNR